MPSPTWRASFLPTWQAPRNLGRMKNLLATVIGACVAMVLTSGVVALATAQSDTARVEVDAPVRQIDDESVPTDEAYAIGDDEIDERISALIDKQYQAVVSTAAEAHRTL
jgi:hypothetical protein